MTPHYSDEWLTIYEGDCRDVLAALPANSVDCVVTSPPYWGLRDYGHDGQLGLERTPEEYVTNMVAVFAEVRRVLKPSGTCWLNLGDSYATGGGAVGRAPGGGDQGERFIRAGMINTQPNRMKLDGLKPKDLVGIPWRVAFALQQPYYTGTIKDEKDRVWLAAMIDAEGCIYIHKRGEGKPNGQGYVRLNATYGSGLEVSNTSLAIVERIKEITGRGSISSVDKTNDERRRQTLYRWNLRTNECRDVLREVYPHLVAKRQQARIAIGCPSSGEAADAAHVALKGLHRGTETSVDFPEPPSMYEPGWYLRSDVIWSKPNPMPESVTDRPTKSHEYLFLLTKSARYYFDADAVKERGVSVGIESIDARDRNADQRRLGGATGKESHASGTRTASNLSRAYAGVDWSTAGRNIRSVWNIATRPYPGAHFAVFPPELPERCIKAGSPEGGVVLDPFGGSGTVGMVANRLSRRAILIDLNPEYLKQQLVRNAQTPLGLEVA